MVVQTAASVNSFSDDLVVLLKHLVSHLMRDRFTLADLLFYAGRWDGAFFERLLERARRVGGPL